MTASIARPPAPIRQRIAAALMLLLVVLSVGLVLRTYSDISGGISREYLGLIAVVARINRLQAEILRLQNLTEQAIATDRPDLAAMRSRRARVGDEVSALRSAVAESSLTGREEQLASLDKLDSLLAQYDERFASLENESPGMVVVLLVGMRADLVEADAYVRSLETQRQRQFEAVSAGVQAATTQARNFLLALAGVVIALGTIFLITAQQTISAEFERAYSRLEAEQAERKRIEDETRDSAERLECLRRRAAQVQAVSEVARAIASVRALDELLPSIAQTISERFGFYHVGIFLIDAESEYAVLKAANSPGGQRMLARGHSLAVGQVGIVGHVAASGQPRIALDVGADAVFFSNPELPDTRSEMGLPLKTGDRVIGVLDVQSIQPSAFGDEDVAVLGTLADQVAIAIENARLFADLERERELLLTANEAGRSLTAEVSLQGVLDVALALAPRVRAMHAYGLVLGPGEEAYFRGTVPGRENMTDEQARDFGYTIARSGLEKWVIEHRQMALVSDTRTDPRWYTAPEHVEEEPARSVISTPLFGPREGLAGVLAYTHPTPGHFSEQDARLVELIGRYVAIALDNVRLFGDVQRERERLLLANDVGQQLVSEVNLDRAVERTLALAPRLGGAAHGNVLLLGPGDAVYFKGTAPGLAELSGAAAVEFGRSIAARGLARWVLANLQTALVYDSRTDPRCLADWPTAPQHEEEEPARSVICVPLAGLPQDMSGTLTYTHPSPGNFTEQDARLVELIARYFAIALANASLLTESQRRARELNQLYEAARLISTELDLERLSEQLVGLACELVAAHYTALLILPADPKGTPIFKTGGMDLNRLHLQGMPEGKGVLAAILEGETVRLDDVRQHPRSIGLPPEHFPLKRLLGLPLVYQGQRRGILLAGRDETGLPFTEADLSLFQALARTAIVAIENACLFQQTSRLAYRERTINEITARILRSADIQGILATTASELGRALGARRARLEIGVPSAERGNGDGQAAKP